MEIQTPQEVDLIFKIINDNGYESFIVGGCVRDSLLGKTPADWDITTNARPEMILEIFGNRGYRVIPTGLKHGTVTLAIEEDYEITTYRIDGAYEDNRRPSSVEFTSNIKEDLSRRDFTINAMAYNHFDGLMDYFNGYEDLKKKSIRCVGDPNKRFQEDALRMMRAIRFTAQLGFNLHFNTKNAIFYNSYLLENISKERIKDEFSKIIITDKPSCYIAEMISIGLMKYVVPEIYECIGFEQHNPNHNKDVLNHILSVLDYTESDLILRLAAFFHDIGKPQTFTKDENGVGHFYSHHLRSADIAEEVMKRLHYDNRTIEQVVILVKEHMSRYEKLRVKSTKRFINRVGIENLDRLFKLQIADINGAANNDLEKNVLELKDEVKRILEEKEPLSVKDLEISGYDIIELGISPGKEIGKVLKDLMEVVLDSPELNKKATLSALVKSRMGKKQLEKEEV